MSITIQHALLLGLACGICKACIWYSFGGFNINTVIFNAVIVGLIMGNMHDAMIIGASIQLIYLGTVAAGGNQPTDPCLASYVAIPIAIASGLDTNAAVALAVPIGLLGSQLTNLVYLINGFFAEKADDFAKQGNGKGIATWGLYIPFIVRTLLIMALVSVTVYFGSTALAGVMNNIPEWLTHGLSAMGACLPAVGFAIIANLISKPKYVVFFFVGFFLVQYTKMATMPLLLAGLFITWLYITCTKDNSTASDEDDDEDEDEEDDEECEEDEEVEGSPVVADKSMLSRKDIFKAWTSWWTWSEVGHSFVRMMAPAFCKAMIPALNKFYPKKDKDPHYREALERHMNFFNSEAHFGGGTVLGLSLAMEEAKSKDYDAMPGDVILNIKTSLMGPMSGIGDTITWSTLMYLLIGLFLPLAQQGNAMGGIGPIVSFTIICFAIGYFLTSRCYTFGYSFAENMLKSGIINIVITAASVLGLFMMGGLAATYVTVTTPIQWGVAESVTTLQSIFDSILPGILPLTTVLLVWNYLKKHRNYFMAAILVTVISLVLGCLGILI